MTSISLPHSSAMCHIITIKYYCNALLFVDVKDSCALWVRMIFLPLLIYVPGIF